MSKPHVPIVNPSRLKVSLKMAISRAQFVQEKKAALAKQQRRQLADLLGQGKETSATIRVENIIRDDIYVELLEYLELYCELLLARISLITDPALPECDENIREAVDLVIYAALFSELKELATIRDMLAAKYGPEFARAAAENTDGRVPDKIVSRCHVPVPTEDLVTLYLCEIARAYNAPYSKMPEAPEAPEDDDEGDDGGAKEMPVEAEGVSPAAPAKPVDEFDALKARFAAFKRG